MVGLKQLLSYLKALSHVYQFMHWRSEGMSYFSDHLMYMRLYEETDAEIDGVAEKTIGVSEETDSIDPIENITSVSEVVIKLVNGEFKQEAFANLGIAAEKQLMALIKEIMSQKPSDGVQNMLQGIADLHEAHLYLLQQRSKKAASVYVKLVKVANHLDSLKEFDSANKIDKILVSLAARTREEIENEKSSILEQIEKIELYPDKDESDQSILSYLREKYKSLEKELSGFNTSSVKVKDLMESFEG